MVYKIAGTLFRFGRPLHTWSFDGPSETLKRKVRELEKMRKKKKSPKRDDFMVIVPESKAFLDTLSMPMVLTAVGVALFAKLLMMLKVYPSSLWVFNMFGVVTGVNAVLGIVYVNVGGCDNPNSSKKEFI